MGGLVRSVSDAIQHGEESRGPTDTNDVISQRRPLVEGLFDSVHDTLGQDFGRIELLIRAVQCELVHVATLILNTNLHSTQARGFGEGSEEQHSSSVMRLEPELVERDGLQIVKLCSRGRVCWRDVPDNLFSRVVMGLRNAEDQY